MTTSTLSVAPKPASGSSLATSAKFRTFGVTFVTVGVLTYLLGIFLRFTLFSYHPVTNLFEWGIQEPHSGQGPVMYWYGWIAMAVLVAGAAGFLATLLPENLSRKIPVDLVWIVPLLASPFLVYSLWPVLTK